MRRSNRLFLTLALILLIATNNVVVNSQSNNAYGAPTDDNNDAYGGSDAFGSLGEVRQSSLPAQSTNKTTVAPSKQATTQDSNKNVVTPAQKANQTAASNNTQPAQQVGKSQTSNTTNENYEYDANGSKGFYGPSIDSGSYGSPSAAYGTSTAATDYGSPLRYNATSQQPSAESPQQPNPEQSSAASDNQPQTRSPTTLFPTSLLTTFAIDFHFVAGYDPHSSSYIAFHFCSGAPNITQCNIYNGVGSNAKLIAVEMVVTQDVFATFPEEERALWHSHEFGVLEGLFVLPEASPAEELEAMRTVITTYGKVTDFYHPGSNNPLGVPQLAYAWTSEEQVVPELVELMEEILSLTTTRAQRKAARQVLGKPALVPGHDEFYETGMIGEYELGYVHVNQEDAEPLE